MPFLPPNHHCQSTEGMLILGIKWLIKWVTGKLMQWWYTCMQMLLDYGAEVNATFATLETTALMTSSFHGHSQIVRMLLDHGANAKAVDTQGSTALGYAFGGSVNILHPFNGLLSRTTWVNWHQKGKSFWILMKQEMMGGSGISWIICKSASWPRHNHASIPPLSFYRPDAISATQPTASKHWRPELNILWTYSLL